MDLLNGYEEIVSVQKTLAGHRAWIAKLLAKNADRPMSEEWNNSITSLQNAVDRIDAELYRIDHEDVQRKKRKN